MIYVGIELAKDKHDCFIVNSDGEILFMNRKRNCLSRIFLFVDQVCKSPVL